MSARPRDLMLTVRDAFLILAVVLLALLLRHALGGVLL